MANYYLMNRDDIMLEFSIENDVLGKSIKEIKSFTNSRPIGFIDIATWLENRNYAKHKSHFVKWLNEWGIDSVEGFINVTHALGINDTLWVKDVDSNLKWSEVNLYCNDFSDVAQHTAFETGLYGLQLSSTDIVSPEFTSEGTCPKCWVNENGAIYLYKAGLSGAVNLGLEPYSEFISSQIAKEIFPESTILYDLVKFKDSLCSKCELFTDEKYGYVPFYKFIDANRSYNLNDVLNICTSMGFENDCRRMLLIDSLIFNQDRHLGNFGFIVDNSSFEIVSFAPIFDFNQSMLCNALDSDLNDFDKYERNYNVGHKLGGTFTDIGKAIITPELLSMIPHSFSFPMHREFNMNDERINKLCSITNEQLKKITQRDYFLISVPQYNNYSLKISDLKNSSLSEMSSGKDNTIDVSVDR